ncbi:MAG: FkbM family methyltransferase [Cytophagaceae bacterium]
MKNYIKYFLQKILGFENYLFLFSLIKIRTLELDRKENDFLYFLNMIPNKGIVLDIGANIGIMTVKLAKRLPNAKIIAFEPVHHNLSTLKKISTYFNLKNVKILDIALGNEEGMVKMVMPVMGSVKMQGLSHVLHSSIKDFNEGETFDVPIKKLDTLPELVLNSEPLTAIKLDVENFEYFVLKGGEERIKKDRPVIYTELWENENREQCFEFVKNLGYSIQVLQKNKLVQFNPEKHKTQNFFMVP